MNELLQAVVKLIEDGLNWQETIISCISVITAGFITWIVVSGFVSIIKVTVTSVTEIIMSVFKDIKNTANSLANVSSSNKPPKIQ